MVVIELIDCSTMESTKECSWSSVMFKWNLCFMLWTVAELLVKQGNWEPEIIKKNNNQLTGLMIFWPRASPRGLKSYYVLVVQTIYFFWHILLDFVMFWYILTFWTYLNVFWTFLTFLDVFGCFWTLLDAFGRFWTVLDVFGPF